MKKTAAFFLFILVFFIYFTVAAEEAKPETVKCGDYEYILLEDGTAEITQYSGKQETVVVPDNMDGYVVTAIGDKAFFPCTSLREITFPDSIVSIGTNPLYSCNKLTRIIVSPDHPYLATIDGVLFSKPDKRLVCYPGTFTASKYSIPQGTVLIGDYAISCKYLTSITIPDSITNIGKWAFSFCESLIDINIPDSVTSIEEHTFAYCYSLADITIPESVTSIGDGAFLCCYSLADITIPESVTSLGGSVFTMCNSLIEVTIPDSVISIGTNPFRYCENLTRIIVSPDHPTLAIINGVLFSKPDKRLVCYPYATSEKYRGYTIPKGIKMIGDYAFDSCPALIDISIPDTVTCIGEGTFRKCSMQELHVPRSVTSIGDRAFASCKALKSVKILGNVTRIGVHTFSECTSLTEVSVPATLTVIDNYAFYRCKSLVSLISPGIGTTYSGDIPIPEGVTSIGFDAFFECESITSVTIPESVASIGSSAFSGCKNLHIIRIPESVTSIGVKAFSKCEFLTAIVARNSYAVQYCKENSIPYNYFDADDWLND